jgi:heterodisulfide reductase subunit A
MSKEKENSKVGAVMVVGGGVGGVQASLDLAESGYKVYLIESSPAIGGVMASLDKTFPTNDCSLCILSPKLVECGRHQNIKIYSYSDVLAVEGEPGNFDVTIKKRARSVDEKACVGCGECFAKCPTKVPSDFEGRLANRKAIYVLYAQAIPNVPVIDKEKCLYYTKGKCKVCEKFCKAKAIRFGQEDEILKLNVGSIILAPGFKAFDAALKPEYGFGRYPNVVNSMQFERILSASGPYSGHVSRPSDKEAPKKVAFIQCVGSRDASCGREYCSAACCMYTTKQAVIAKEHSHGLDATIFYMDMRAYGKDFDRYIIRAESEYGVRYVRARVAAIDEVPSTKNLRIKFETEEGKLDEEEFNLVVLSVGLDKPADWERMKAIYGIELNEYGFAKTSDFAPLETNRPGIFVSGAFAGPKDIPETVMQSSGAAGNATALLAKARGLMVTEKAYPSQIDVTGQEPRIGAFVCHCGINIGGVVNVPQVVEFVKTLPNVVYAEENLYTCSQNTQDKIKEVIRDFKLNRIFVASCSPRTHEPLFRETVKEAGLNPYLCEMANIRDQCSWVHMHEPQAATEKAKTLVRMGIAKIFLLDPLQQKYVDVNHNALVIGGGLAGMTAALSLADNGFKTYLIEKTDELGGNLRHIHYTLKENDVRSHLNAVIEKVKNHKLIELHLNTDIKSVEGYVGNFTTNITAGGKEKELKHGVVVVATGATEYKPSMYQYGQDPRVLTQSELEEKLAAGTLKKAPKTIVMIQCVDSRNSERPYCSRYCCTQAVKNALKLKEKYPDAQIYILYRDIRTYGFKELAYNELREKGALFIRYEVNEPPIAEMSDGKLLVTTNDLLLDSKLVIEPDLLVLSTPTVAPEENKKLSQMLKVPLNADGFFLEAHVKLRPVDFATEGVFVCGLAHSPKFIDESIYQAQAAAARAVTVLSKERLSTEGIVAQINPNTCVGCRACLEVCPYGAISYLDEKGICEVNAVLCKGCGTCTAACVSGSVNQGGFKDYQIYSQIENAFVD